MADKKERFMNKKVDELTVGETLKYTALVTAVFTGAYIGLAAIGAGAVSVYERVKSKLKKPEPEIENPDNFDWEDEDEPLEG